MTFSPTKRLAAEGLGTGLLVATVAGSGVMGEKLAGGNVALALRGNSSPTGAIARALTDSFCGIAPGGVAVFVVAQFAGALAGLSVMRWFFAASDVAERLAASERA